jgi:hypothetical protein
MSIKDTIEKFLTKKKEEYDVNGYGKSEDLITDCFKICSKLTERYLSEDEKSECVDLVSVRVQDAYCGKDKHGKNKDALLVEGKKVFVHIMETIEEFARNNKKVVYVECVNNNDLACSLVVHGYTESTIYPKCYVKKF